MSIAACLIVKDEIKHIKRILDNISPHVDGVFIYDTGSTDGTQEVARSCGAKVEQGVWRKDFSEARNHSYDLPGAEYDWLVYFDADDQVDGLDKLRGLADNAISSVDAFSFPYHNDWSGIEVNYHTTRMVRRSSGYRWRYPLHEQLEIDGREHNVKNDDIIWRQSHTWQDRIAKTERNLDVLLSQPNVSHPNAWLAMGVVSTLLELGRAREAFQWLQERGLTITFLDRYGSEIA